jgi:antitoxin component HigA of HigAB toxin-antitoxin module
MNPQEETNELKAKSLGIIREMGDYLTALDQVSEIRRLPNGEAGMPDAQDHAEICEQLAAAAEAAHAMAVAADEVANAITAMAAAAQDYFSNLREANPT